MSMIAKIKSGLDQDKKIIKSTKIRMICYGLMILSIILFTASVFIENNIITLRESSLILGIISLSVIANIMMKHINNIQE